MPKKVALAAGLTIFLAIVACIAVAVVLIAKIPPPTPISGGPSDTEVVELIHQFYKVPSGTFIISVRGKAPCDSTAQKWSVVYYQETGGVMLRKTMAFQQGKAGWEWAPFVGCKADLPY